MYRLAHGEAVWTPDAAHGYHVLIEVSGSNARHDNEKLDALLEAAMDQGVVCDGAVAQDGTQTAAMWALREGISEACTRRGALYKYDLSVPVKESHALAEAVRERLGLPSVDAAAPSDSQSSSSTSTSTSNSSSPPASVAASPYGACEVVTFGHLGDGNVHLNVTAVEQSQELVDRLEPFIYDWTAERGGSVSAEHGVGLQKRHAVARTKDPAALLTMQTIKNALDPKGILNPYKVFLEPEEIKGRD
jgi:FAD/FMN-containing dehydrogenase